MLKLPPFTLVHRRSEGSRKHKNDLQRIQLELIRGVRPKLAESLASLKPSIRATLIDSSLPRTMPATKTASKAFPLLENAITELKREPKVIKVGLWDIGARAGRLPQIIRRLNKAQPTFTFFEVQAAVPVGIVSRPEYVLIWAEERLGRTLRKRERMELLDNVIADTFFHRAEQIRKELGIDYLAGITPSMVAGEDEEGVYWNHFTSHHGRLIIASTYELRDFANKAGRPFEAAVAALVIAQLMVAINPKLVFHEDRGCAFDYNEDRETVVTGLREPKIEAACMALIAPRYRSSVAAFVKVLKAYK